MSSAGQRHVVEKLLTEEVDGDFLVGCGRSIGNTGGDVPIRGARAAEVAWWATEAAGRWFADWCEAVIAGEMGVLQGDYADGWRDASAAFLAELRGETS